MVILPYLWRGVAFIDDVFYVFTGLLLAFANCAFRLIASSYTADFSDTSAFYTLASSFLLFLRQCTLCPRPISMNTQYPLFFLSSASSYACLTLLQVHGVYRYCLQRLITESGVILQNFQCSKSYRTLESRERIVQLHIRV